MLSRCILSNTLLVTYVFWVSKLALRLAVVYTEKIQVTRGCFMEHQSKSIDYWQLNGGCSLKRGKLLMTGCLFHFQNTYI